MGDGERRTLAAIARGPGRLMAKSVLDGVQLARSTARDARDRLIEEGFVQGEGDELEIVDPLLAQWVASGRLGLTDALEAL